MRKTTSRRFPILTALLISLGLAACSGNGEARAEGESGRLAQPSNDRPEGGEGIPSEREGERADGEGREGGEHDEGGRGEGGESGEHNEGGEGREGGEHGGDEGGHDEGEEGEEPGIYIARGDTWDMTRRGARLVLSFNAERSAFVGTVENTTDLALCAVRVEVHLTDGPELGPTPRTDVPAGGAIEVELATEGASFETWTAHPELSACSGQ